MATLGIILILRALFHAIITLFAIAGIGNNLMSVSKHVMYENGVTEPNLSSSSILSQLNEPNNWQISSEALSLTGTYFKQVMPSNR